MPGAQTTDRPEPFKLFLRTAFYDRILDQNTTWTSSINIARAQAQAIAAANQVAGVAQQAVPAVGDPYGEAPFEILSRANNAHGVTVQHSNANTSIRLIGQSQESKTMAIAALRLLSDLNRESPVLEGQVKRSHYELTFDLHIEDLSQLQDMMEIARASDITLSRYLLNNQPIPEATLRAALQGHQAQNPAHHLEEQQPIPRYASAPAA